VNNEKIVVNCKKQFDSTTVIIAITIYLLKLLAMKKLITFTLGIAFLIPSLCWSLNSPTVVWPIQAGYYVHPGANQLFQVQTNVNNCVAYVTLYTINAGVKTLVETKEIKAKKNHNHVDLHIKIPQCLATSELCIGVRNKKGTSYSNEVFRYLTSSQMEISIPYPVPFLQFKCMDDPWEPIIPKGCKASLSNPTPAPTQNYNGLVHYFENFQNPFSDSPIATTNNGTGFSPYHLPYSPQQQEMGGVFKYTIPAPPCSPKGNLFNQMMFTRPNIPYTLIDFPADQTIINPEMLPCSDKVKCNLPQVTFVYLPSVASIDIPYSSILDVKYYAVENGQLIENGYMTNAGTVFGYPNPIGQKIVCYDHLLDQNGDAVTRNYIVEYIFTTSLLIPIPSYQTIDITCRIQIPTSVSPTNSPALVTASNKVQEFINLFNNLMSQFGQLPGVNEKYICDLIFTLFDALPNGIDRVDDIAFNKNLSEEVLARITNVLSAVNNSEDVLTTYWLFNSNKRFETKDFTPNENGHYQLFIQNKYGVSKEVYTLTLKTNKPVASWNLIDIVDDSLYALFFEGLPNDLKSVEQLKNQHSKEYNELKDRKNVVYPQLYFSNNDMNLLSEVKVYPNPVNDILSFESSIPFNFDGFSFIIYSIEGKELHHGEINSTGQINIESLPQGKYIIKLIDSSQIHTVNLKFLKQ
jgi:hypothetical protein